MKNLKGFLEEERKKSDSNLVSLTKNINSAAKAYDFKKLLFFITEFKEMDVKPALAPGIVKFFMESNLFFMGDDLNLVSLTFGADPEFILCDSDGNVVLYSSKYRLYSSKYGEFSMSSLSIGADYGLLELRPDYSTKTKKLVDGIEQMIELFNTTNVDQGIKIKEIEAIPFLHKIERLREVMDEIADGGKELDYGSNRAKMGGVSGATISDIDIAGAEYYGVSLTAYDTPGFAVGTDKVLTAGGHLHFGGSIIKALSMKQLKALVRRLDEKLIPIAKKVETEAAELRKKYYGFPGEFRLKEYGFEYRVLSCAPFWTKNKKTLKEILVEAERIITNFDF